MKVRSQSTAGSTEMAPLIVVMVTLASPTPVENREPDCAMVNSGAGAAVEARNDGEHSLGQILEWNASRLQPQPSTPDSNCLVRFDELTGNELLVDQRTSRQREAWPVANSLLGLPNDSSYLDAFASGSVVLFGTGRDDQRLIQQCEDWNAAGAPHIRVLRGGVLAIAAATPGGQDLVPESLYLLSSSELLRLAREGAPIFHADDNESDALSWQGELGRPLASHRSAVLEEEDGARAGGLPPNVVLLPVGVSPAQWRREQGSNASPRTVFHNQGLEAFRSETARAQAIASNAYKPLPSGSCGR